MIERVKDTLNKNTLEKMIIRINFNYGIRMHKNVFNVLGRPYYMHFWWSENAKVLAVSASNKPTNMSVTIPDYFCNNRNGYKLRQSKLRKAIRLLVGQDDKNVINFIGKFEPQSKTAIFKMQQTETGEESHD